jgi:xylose isomerase
VWAAAAANMSMYLLLRERAQAFRADPEVKAALARSRVLELAEPTLNPGEGWAALLADPAQRDFDADAAGQPGYGFVELHQLAVEHLLGAR